MGHTFKIHNGYICINIDANAKLMKYIENLCKNTSWNVDLKLYDYPTIVCDHSYGYDLWHIKELEKIIDGINKKNIELVDDHTDFLFTSIPEDSEYLFITKIVGEPGNYKTITKEVNFINETFTEIVPCANAN